MSRHLRVLSQAGLVHAEDHGRERHCRLDAGPLAAVRDVIVGLEGDAGRAPVTASALDALETEIHRVSRDRRKAARTTSTAPTTQEDIA